MDHKTTAGEIPQGKLIEGLFYGLIVALLWGGWLAASYQGIAEGMSAWDIALIRYSTSGLLLCPLLVLNKAVYRIHWHKSMVLTLLAGPLLLWFALAGYSDSPLVHGAFVQLTVLILFSMLLSALILKERFGWPWITGVVILLCGLMLIVEPGWQSGLHYFYDDLMFAASGVMLAVFILLVRLWHISAMSALILVSVYSALFYIPLYLLFKGPWYLLMMDSALLWEQVLVQGVLSGVVALFAFSKAALCLGMRRAAIFPALSPVIALGIGMPFSGQLPGMTQYAGLALALSGFAIALLNTRKKLADKP
jgi:drug/metabolite transporter (DMT)-like permease